MKRNVQEEHRRDLWRIIERDFSGSLMNDTKWTEVLLALQELGLRYRVKLITKDSASSWGGLAVGEQSRLPFGYVEGCGYSPIQVLEIEWLDIETFSRVCSARYDDHAEEIEERLRSVGAPFTKDGPIIRIWGHTRR